MSISPGEKIIHGNSILTRPPPPPLCLSDFVAVIAITARLESILCMIETVNRDVCCRIIILNGIIKLRGRFSIFEGGGKGRKGKWLNI